MKTLNLDELFKTFVKTKKKRITKIVYMIASGAVFDIVPRSKIRLEFINDTIKRAYQRGDERALRSMRDTRHFLNSDTRKIINLTQLVQTREFEYYETSARTVK
jgi:hypothetical protein